MGKKDPGEPDFGLRAHSTEWWGPVSGRPSGHPAGPIRGVVRTAVRPDSGVGPARFSAWPATGPRAGHLVRTRKKRSGPAKNGPDRGPARKKRSGPAKNGPDRGPDRKKRSGPFGPATLARLAGPLWGGGPARFRGGPDGWPARFVGRSGPIGGVVRPDLWGGPARLGGWSGPIWGVVRTGGRRSGHPPDRVEPTTYRTPVPMRG